MAFARDVYTATGSDPENFTVTFPYLDEDHVKVYVDGVVKVRDTDYEIISSTTVRFSSSTTVLDGGETVVVQRETSRTERLVDYEAASSLTESDLDNDSLQAFYLVQEAIDAADLALGLDTDNQWTAEDKRIKDVATPTDATDAVTKAYADALVALSGNVPTPDDPDDDDGLLIADSGAFAWATAMAGKYLYLAATTTIQYMTRVSNDAAQGLGFRRADGNAAGRLQHNSGASGNIELVKNDSSTPANEAVAIRLEDDKIVMRMDGGTVRWQIDESDVVGEAMVRTNDKWEGFPLHPVTHGDSPVSLASGDVTVTGFPDDVYEIVIVISGISLDGTQEPVLKLGNSGGIGGTYSGATVNDAGSTKVAWSNLDSSGAIAISTALANAANVIDSVVRLTRADTAGLIWGVEVMSSRDAGPDGVHGAGLVTLTTNPLDRIQFTGDSTAVPDAGTAYVHYRRSPAG